MLLESSNLLLGWVLLISLGGRLLSLSQAFVIVNNGFTLMHFHDWLLWEKVENRHEMKVNFALLQ
jgi:hypothetical protein